MPTPYHDPKIYDEWEEMEIQLLHKIGRQPFARQSAWRQIAEMYDVSYRTVRSYLRVGHPKWVQFNLHTGIVHAYNLGDIAGEFTIADISETLVPANGTPLTREEILRAMNDYTERFGMSFVIETASEKYRINSHFYHSLKK